MQELSYLRHHMRSSRSAVISSMRWLPRSPMFRLLLAKPLRSQRLVMHSSASISMLRDPWVCLDSDRLDYYHWQNFGISQEKLSSPFLLYSTSCALETQHFLKMCSRPFWQMTELSSSGLYSIINCERAQRLSALEFFDCLCFIFWYSVCRWISVILKFSLKSDWLHSTYQLVSHSSCDSLLSCNLILLYH